jgi:hypothetical protein
MGWLGDYKSSPKYLRNNHPQAYHQSRWVIFHLHTRIISSCSFWSWTSKLSHLNHLPCQWLGGMIQPNTWQIGNHWYDTLYNHPFVIAIIFILNDPFPFEIHTPWYICHFIFTLCLTPRGSQTTQSLSTKSTSMNFRQWCHTRWANLMNLHKKFIIFF